MNRYPFPVLPHLARAFATRAGADDFATADIAALGAGCHRLKVGAVITVTDTTLGHGESVNVIAANVRPDNEPCTHGASSYVSCREAVHAEVRAVTAARNLVTAALVAGRELDEFALSATVTHAPCLPCAWALAEAGVARVAYSWAYWDSDGIEYLFGQGVLVAQASRDVHRDGYLAGELR